MSEKPKVGDRVSWNTSQGRTTGRVVQKLTVPSHVRGHKVAATPQHPEYLVVSDRSGDKAAHKAAALKKLKGKKR